MKKFFKFLFLVSLVLFLGGVIGYHLLLLDPPVVKDTSALKLQCESLNDSTSICGDAWLHRGNAGIHELYISGQPFEMGVKNGMLTQSLAAQQENAFLAFIKSIVPSDIILNYLKYFVQYH